MKCQKSLRKYLNLKNEHIMQETKEKVVCKTTSDTPMIKLDAIQYALGTPYTPSNF